MNVLKHWLESKCFESRGPEQFIYVMIQRKQKSTPSVSSWEPRRRNCFHTYVTYITYVYFCPLTWREDSERVTERLKSVQVSVCEAHWVDIWIQDWSDTWSAHVGSEAKLHHWGHNLFTKINKHDAASSTRTHAHHSHDLILKKKTKKQPWR